MIRALRDSLARGGGVRVVNYHNAPAQRAAQYDAEFAALAARFDPVDEAVLDAFLTTGDWPGARPGVIPAFYNGYRNTYDVARPLLEKHGLVGWFFAVSGYSGCPAAAQLSWGAERALVTVPDEYADGRYALSWDELRALDKRHVVASHTRSHSKAGLDDPGRLDDEIVGAQEDFTRELGHRVRSFAWLSGSPYGQNPAADAAVDRAGYDFLFSNLSVQRLPRGPGCQAE